MSLAVVGGFIVASGTLVLGLYIYSWVTPSSISADRQYGPLCDPIEQAWDAYRQADFGFALEISQPLAAVGNADAQALLGNLYWRGLGVDEDIGRALRFYRQAANQGHVGSASLLGDLYTTEHGVAGNLGEAAHYYRIAADHGDRTAQIIVAGIYASGWLDTPPNYSLAAHYFRLAATGDSAIAQAYLGSLYADGLGLDQDLTEAYALLLLAQEPSRDPIVEILDIFAARRWRFDISNIEDVLGRIVPLMNAEEMREGERRAQVRRAEFVRLTDERNQRGSVIEETLPIFGGISGNC